MRAACSVYAVHVTKAIQIRHVPDEVHAVLRVRAARAGLSLSDYLLREITALASRPTVEEVLAHAALRGGPELSFEQVVEAIHEGRAGRP
jgi:plasmid stability protein